MAQTHSIGKVATSVYTRSTDGRNYTCVKYHATEVVIFSNDTILLDSGGWRTVTTKTRMNQASNQYGLGYQVYQKDHVWYVDFKGQSLRFDDGMVLTR